ncbi:MAG: hypothetical protein WAL38_23990, partial [Solirubrobacteraceae bacterium]
MLIASEQRTVPNMRVVAESAVRSAAALAQKRSPQMWTSPGLSDTRTLFLMLIVVVRAIDLYRRAERVVRSWL